MPTFFVNVLQHSQFVRASPFLILKREHQAIGQIAPIEFQHFRGSGMKIRYLDPRGSIRRFAIPTRMNSYEAIMEKVS
jgi:hypothetical protein